MVSSEWSPVTKRAVAAGLVAVLLISLYLLRALLPPFALAVALSYLLKPLVDRLERRTRMPRMIAVVLVYLALLVLAALVPVTIVPYIVAQVARAVGALQGLANAAADFLEQPIVVLNWRFRPQDLLGDVPGAVQNLIRPFATQGINLLFSVASSLLWVISILVISFYLVKDAARLRAFLDRIAPPGYSEELRNLREQINQVWRAFFRGQLILGLIVGLAVWITMMAVGLPNAGLMGLTAGLLEAIPNFGPVLATVPSALTAFLQGSTYLPLSNLWFTVLVLGIYIVIQQIENNYLVPRIMSRRMQLHPVVVFVGVLAGGYLIGVLGVLLAAPILGTLRVLVRYVYAKLLGVNPFPSLEEEPGQELYPGEIDAILLDLDGTLAETDDQAAESLARHLGRLRRVLPNRDAAGLARRLLMASEGPATRILSLLDRVGLDDNLLGANDWLCRLRGVLPSSAFRPMAGAADLVHDLNRRYRLALVTTRTRREAEAFLAEQGLTGLFQVVTGREETWRIKPHAAPIRHTAQRLGVPVERCLMVGDTTADIQSARAAGARSVGVLCGLGQRAELERAGADLILDRTTQLADHL